MPKWMNFLKSFKWRLTPKKMASSKEILFPLKMVASIPLNVVSVMKHDQRKRDSGSSEMPTPSPPFHLTPSFLSTRLQWDKFASNPLTSDAFKSVAAQQLLTIHVTAAMVKMSIARTFQLLEYQWGEGRFDKQTSSLH